MIDMLSPLGQRLLRSGGKIESGQIANMRTYLLPRRACIHVRILGESTTLCGRAWMPGGWQFINRGDVTAGHVPAHADEGDRDACKACAKTPVMQAVYTIARARRKAFGRAA